MNRAGFVVSKSVLLPVSLVVIFLTALSSEETKPRVFITDSTSWEVSGAAGGSGVHVHVQLPDDRE